MPRRFSPPARWPVQDASRYKPLDWFVPYERNARTHPDSQIELLASLLTKYGPDQDIVVDEDRIILKGHGRLAAARQAGLTHFLFTQRTGLTESQKQAIRIEDNQVALLGGWDKELVTSEIVSLKTGGYDILQLGFGEAQLRGWGIQIGTEGARNPDEVPEPPKVPIVRSGDLWLLGDHRLICGDCTDVETVKRLLGRDRPNLMVTDPPYGVKYDPKWRDDLGLDWMGQAQRRSTHPNTKPLKSRSLGKVQNDDTADWTAAWNLFRGDIAYVWHGGLHAGEVQRNLEDSGLNIRAQIIWAKQHFVFSRGDYHWQHEPCWYAVRKTGNWTGDRKQTTVWNISNASAFRGEEDDVITGHGTQKPVECMKRPMENNSSAGDYIYEPFCGSGTTIIAGEMTDRRVLAIEIDPAYCEVIVTRWQQFANAVATCGGRTLDQLRADRRRTSRNSRQAVQQVPRGQADDAVRTRQESEGRSVPSVRRMRQGVSERVETPSRSRRSQQRIPGGVGTAT